MLPLLSQLVCVISCSMFGSVAYVTCHGQWQLHFCNVAVYRASFRQTYAEINARTGEWKIILAGVLFLLSVSGWFTIFVKRYGECSLPVYSFKSIMVLHCYWACLLLVMFSLFYIWSLLLWVSVCHKPSHCIYMHTQSHTASSNTKHSALSVFCSNHSFKMHHFWPRAIWHTDGWTDSRRAYFTLFCQFYGWGISHNNAFCQSDTFYFLMVQ